MNSGAIGPVWSMLYGSELFHSPNRLFFSWLRMFSVKMMVNFKTIKKLRLFFIHGYIKRRNLESKIKKFYSGLKISWLQKIIFEQKQWFFVFFSSERRRIGWKVKRPENLESNFWINPFVTLDFFCCKPISKNSSSWMLRSHSNKEIQVQFFHFWTTRRLQHNLNNWKLLIN